MLEKIIRIPISQKYFWVYTNIIDPYARLQICPLYMFGKYLPQMVPIGI